MNRRATQQCNMSPYVYAVYWLPPASSAFLLARKCNWLAEKMLITCVMRHARLQKLQRFRRKMPFYSFLILWQSIDEQCHCIFIIFLRSLLASNIHYEQAVHVKGWAHFLGVMAGQLAVAICTSLKNFHAFNHWSVSINAVAIRASCYYYMP